MSVSASKFSVAISGGGVGGLALAAFISPNSNVVVDIYEGKPEISTVGAGIAIWKRSWQVLQDIGLDAELVKRNIPAPREGEVRGPVYRKSDQPEEGFDFHSHIMPYGPLMIPRPVLLDMLKAKLGYNCKVHTSRRVTGFIFEETGCGVSVEFSDGTSSHADVLIGADGVHSATRESLFGILAANATPSNAELYTRYALSKWSGTLAYRCSLSADKLKITRPEHRALLGPQIWCGKHKHVVTYPIGARIHLVGYHAVEDAEGTPFTDPLVAEVPVQEVIDCYKGWEPDICEMLQLVEKLSRWAIHVVDPLPLAVSNGVALLGDAAHAMIPHQGVGGGQAIEDAHLLGHLLSHPDVQLRHIPDVLRIYQDIRLPFAQRAAELSRLSGLMYGFNHPDYPIDNASSTAEYEKLGNAIGGAFGWLAQGGCDEDWIKAKQQLEDIISS